MQLQPLDDPKALQPLLEQAPLEHIRQRTLLQRVDPRQLKILVDDPAAPGASLVFDGRLWDLAAADVGLGKAALDAFPFDGSGISFAGLDEPFLHHLTERREVRWHTPADLYVRVETDHPPLPAPTAELSSLTLGDLPQLDEAWPHGRGVPGRLDYLRQLIEQGPTVAAREGGALASFGVAHADGALGILHTEPAFRRRGLGRAVLARLIQAVQDGGWLAYGHVVRGNQPSVDLVESLGMRPIRPAEWIGVR